MKLKISLTLCFYLFILSCTHTPPPTDISPSERGNLSVLLVNLSSAVDAYFSTLSEAPTENDSDILSIATIPDPSLLSPQFNDYLLKVQYQQHHAVLLLCTKDGKVALMEDAGCSARLDRQVTNNSPCEFTLNVLPNCQIKAN